MQEKPTMDDFAAFVNRQPENKMINHFRWNECAVGEFLKDFHKINQFELFVDNRKEYFLNLLEKENNKLFEILNGNGCNPDEPDHPLVAETYGDLKDLIEESNS